MYEKLFANAKLDVVAEKLENKIKELDEKAKQEQEKIQEMMGKGKKGQ